MRNQQLITATLLLVGLSSTIPSFGQQNTVSSGGVASGSGGTVTYSIGQVAYSNETGTNGNVNQGVQQPYEFYSLGVNESSLNFNLSAFPNPTTDVIYLTIDNFQGEQLSYQLIDMNGKLISKQAILEKETAINMESLPSANYFINLVLNNEIVQAYKIIKN